VIESFTSLNTSLHWWYSTVLTPEPKPETKLAESASWVDVRDIALAHVLALEKAEAGGERIIISEGSCVWQEWGAYT